MEKIGKIFWQDLTVEDAEQVRDFYSAVVGWAFEKVSLGDYDDYNMLDPQDKEVAAGICHKRGVNKNIPSQWLNYVMVENMDQSVAACLTRGGKVVDGPKKTGKYLFALIQDPAGAYLALMQEAKPSG